MAGWRAQMACSLRCLVLNASMEPISVVSAQRGLVLLLKERAMMLERTQMKTSLKEKACHDVPEQRTVQQEQCLLFKSERNAWEVPSVIVLRHYVNVNESVLKARPRTCLTLAPKQHTKRKAVSNNSRYNISTANVLRRDGMRCVYCGDKAASMDHVVPLSRGGRHAWENVVAACLKCNHKKGNKLVSECGKEFKMPAPKMLKPPNDMLLRLGILWNKGGPSNPHWAQFFASFPEICREGEL